VLGLVNPEAFGRSSRIARYAEAIAVQMQVPDLWCVKTAAHLSQLGCVILPEATLTKLYHGEPLTPEESQLFDQHPLIDADLLKKIPRMEQVAEIIAYQEKHFDGSGVPRDERRGATIPLGARILKVALDFDACESAGLPKHEALACLTQRKGWYDPAVLEALKTAFAREIQHEVRWVGVDELVPGMILDQDVEDRAGRLLLAKGQEVTTSVVVRFQHVREVRAIKEPIKALVPLKEAL
jgi:response regulator RpfG family c-di-GMP phosphodiesterase